MKNETNIVNFLRQVITSNTITNEMRQEALDLRDSIILLKDGAFINGYSFSIKQLQELRSLNKIPAIRRCREWTNWELKEAKDFVEDLDK